MGTRSVQDAISAFLATKCLFVVLDNFEHLLEAAPVVSDLLSAGLDNAVLVTSREPLRLRGEREVAVAPPPVPDVHRLESRTDIAQNPTIALFVQRAQAVRADFELKDENAATIAAICRHLDGLPLAIELAAARGKVLPPSVLLARLDTRLPLLADGPRDAPARQRTLRDTIALSHDLLDEEERRLFRRLSVFAGGWTLETDEAVANSNGTIDVFSGITSLGDKSLVRQVDQRDGEPRFTILGTIREFGLEQLAASDEMSSVRNAHAAVFRILGEDCQRDYAVRGAQWLAQLVAEADTVRAALVWGDQTDDRETGLALAVALGYMAMHCGGLAEPQPWLSRFLAGDAPLSQRRAHATVYEGVLTLFLGESAVALAMAKAGEDIARAVGSNVDVGFARLIQAMALQDLEE